MYLRDLNGSLIFLDDWTTKKNMVQWHICLNFKGEKCISNFWILFEKILYLIWEGRCISFVSKFIVRVIFKFTLPFLNIKIYLIKDFTVFVGIVGIVLKVLKVVEICQHSTLPLVLRAPPTVFVASHVPFNKNIRKRIPASLLQIPWALKSSVAGVYVARWFYPLSAGSKTWLDTLQNSKGSARLTLQQYDFWALNSPCARQFNFKIW